MADGVGSEEPVEGPLIKDLGDAPHAAKAIEEVLIEAEHARAPPRRGVARRGGRGRRGGARSWVRGPNAHHAALFAQAGACLGWLRRSFGGEFWRGWMHLCRSIRASVAASRGRGAKLARPWFMCTA